MNLVCAHIRYSKQMAGGDVYCGGGNCIKCDGSWIIGPEGTAMPMNSGLRGEAGNCRAAGGGATGGGGVVVEFGDLL